MPGPQHDSEHERRVREAESAMLQEVQRLIPKDWRLPIFQVDIAVKVEAPRAGDVENHSRFAAAFR